MSAFNPLKFLQFKPAWDNFAARHPKFVSFIQLIAKSGLAEGTIIDIKITTPEGKELSSNMRVTAEDIELIQSLKNQ